MTMKINSEDQFEEGKAMRELSPEQRADLMLSYQESLDETQLIDHDTVKAAIKAKMDKDRWNSLSEKEQNGLEIALNSFDQDEGIAGDEAWASIIAKFNH